MKVRVYRQETELARKARKTGSFGCPNEAFKEQCVFEYGYVVESEVRTVGGKPKRFQKKTPISYVLAPQADGNGGGGNG